LKPLRGVALLLAAYACFTLAVAGVRNLHANAWVPSLVALLVAGLTFAFGRGGGAHDQRLRAAPSNLPSRAIWWALLPLVFVPVLYAQVGSLVHGVPVHDASILAIEHRWFGEPARTWSRQFPSPLLSLPLHIGYLSYYLIIYLPPLRLALRRDERALTETVLALLLAFIASFVCFVVWPVEGPRYRWPPVADVTADPVRSLTTAILERFSSRGAAFPSSHVSVSVVQTLMAWRWQRRLVWLLTPLTLALALGAVYGGFHYLTDVVAGASLGVIIVAIVLQRDWLRRALQSRRVGTSIALALASVFLNGCATAPGGQRRFYASRDYGSERQFNPVSQIVNEGFDLLRGDEADRRLFELPYGVTARNVRSSVLNFGQSINRYGWSRFIRNEILPLSTKTGGGGQWVPNYQFHLLGSGMVSARMTEWFEQHDIAHPVLWSAVTMTASHVLNEMTERPGPMSVDAATDLLLFDTGGLLLFRSDRVQRAFSGRVQLTNWALQPSYTLPGETLENMGQQFVLRFKVPRATEWRGLYMFGVSTLFGVSRNLGRGRAFSVAFGADAVETAVVDEATDTRTVILKPNAGVFLDRDGSLLASLVVRNGYESVATLNVYPGAISSRRFPLGLWLSTLRGGGVRVGVASPWGIGVARGSVRTP